nr:MAG: hypothetical protein 3 [Leviviridae sp.]
MKTADIMVELQAYAATTLDIAAWDSGLLPDLIEDLKHLNELVRTRGLSIILIDLPEAGKYFDRCLSSEFSFDSSNLPVSFGHSSGRKRRYLFSTLLEKVFDENGRIHPTVDPNSVFFIRQMLYLAKKVRKDCSNDAIRVEVQSFEEVDSQLRRPSLRWEGDEPLDFDPRASGLSFLDGFRDSPDLVSHRDTCPKPLLRVLEQVCDLVVTGFPELDWRDLSPRHGPGAVSDARTGTDKYLFPNWPRKLAWTFPYEFFGQSREDLHLDFEEEVPSYKEPPAKLLAVPKTFKGPRLITSEPVAHQYCQQAVLRWIRDNLPSSIVPSIDFLSQQPSKDAALAASISGSTATVDLKSASDRLSCWTVERMFRRNPSILNALHACRTRVVHNAVPDTPFFAAILRKYAGQGNATTFPVQTIAYTCIAIACVLYQENRSVSYRNVRLASRKIRVFGDDIVMPSSGVQSLELLLAHLELKVNVSKTHVKGHFRESCGMDAYMGYTVTPVYIRDLTPPNTVQELQSWVDVCNNAYSAGLWWLADWMRVSIPERFQGNIPTSNVAQGCIALRSYQAGLISRRNRQNKALFRPEILGYQETTRTDRRRRDTHANLLQFFIEEPNPQITWSAGFNVRYRKQIRLRWVPVQA